MEKSGADVGRVDGWRKVASSFSDHLDGEGAANAAVPRVLRALLAKIDAGEYQPGQKINTVELANSLGLSRAPVREALHILAGKGIVKLLPDRGAILRPFSKTRLIETIQVLHCLMRHALVATAERIEEGDNRALLQSHLARIKEASRPPVTFEFWLHIHDFLHDVAQMGGNTLIEELSLSLNLDLHARTFEKYIPVAEHIDRYADTFRRMCEALIAGDGRAAVATGDFHTEWQVAMLRKARE